MLHLNIWSKNIRIKPKVSGEIPVQRPPDGSYYFSYKRGGYLKGSFSVIGFFGQISGFVNNYTQLQGAE